MEAISVMDSKSILEMGNEEVIKQEVNYLKKGGKLIFHLPFLHIVDKKNYKHHLKENFEAFSYK